MLKRQAFKFELMPNGEQARRINQFCGCSRFVFNRGLDWQNTQYAQDNNFKFSYTKIANLLPQWKKTFPWLKDCYSQVLQQSLKDLESAFKNFFQKRGNFPKFKKKGIKERIRFPQGCKLEQHNNRLYLPKIGWVRYRNSRNVVGEIKNVTVSKKCGRFYASIQTECEVEIPKHQGKVKFSKNWQKLQARIAKLHHKIANCRKDFLHKISTTISKNHAMIYVEDLQVSNMSKSAKGTVEAPGQNVKQKSGLNRAILDQSWTEFRRQLDYKSQWQGGVLVAVPPHNTSRTCPCCGHTDKENRPTQAKFECVECGYTENADMVGAINILERGRAIAKRNPTGGDTAGALVK